MRPLSLATKFNLLIAAAFSTIFVFNIVTIANRVHAGFDAELKSNFKLAKELAIMETVAGRDPVVRLRQVFENPDYRQRVDIRVIWSGPPGREAMEAAPAAEETLASPYWFSALVSPEPRTLRIPVTVNGMMKFGQIELVFYPDLEAEKAWSNLTRLAFGNLVALGLICAVVLALMNRWLQPFKAIGDGLLRLERGFRSVRLAPEGATEFVDTAVRLNALAQTLDRVEGENRTLLERLVKMQDDERATIARDLHDEVAPCLFAIRTGVLALSASEAATGQSGGRVPQICGEISSAGNALQDVVHRMLDELRPPGLYELGLEPALRGLIANRRAMRPDIAVTLEAPHDLRGMGEAVELTAYRVVQEALTNIFRHSSARNAKVALRFEHPASLEEESLILRITVSDDGVGIGAHQRRGRGLVGMSERVRALNGALEISAAPSGGAIVDVTLPLPIVEPVEENMPFVGA
ncbi:histidine kinase [Methylocystis parvus]|uniref:ATP-binding protein n=1 Tax=Methylocystis parvus TaxID=134 RepID=A0A6B8M7C9_9HYPH|nr:ATP-binding protein [Methylocystis parvus]QGM96710.1 ATP-binding protein [Methylocystis parvus]WBJ99424.1 histidine kinase [Methylocystis parvus OBBP]